MEICQSSSETTGVQLILRYDRKSQGWKKGLTQMMTNVKPQKRFSSELYFKLILLARRKQSIPVSRKMMWTELGF